MCGLIHIYTGDGKGKTTAAVGLAVRAAGRGRRVLFVQFLKDNSSGEIASLRKLGVTVRGLSKSYGFVFQMDAATRALVTAEHNALLQTVLEECRQGLWDLVILDEIMAACQLMVADAALVDELLAQRPQALELVLTGRDAPQKWLKQAHYVTEMVARRHPYEAGIAAREGVEY